jgi:hypothetical protein
MFFAADFYGVFHHTFTTILPHLPRKTPRFSHAISQNPRKNAKITTQKKICTTRNLKPANQKLALIHHLRRKMIVQQDKQLLVPHNLLLPLVPVHHL